MFPPHENTDCLGKCNYFWAEKTTQVESQAQHLHTNPRIFSPVPVAVVMACPREGSKETSSSPPAWIFHRDPTALQRPPEPRLGLSLSGDSREGLRGAASALQVPWDVQRNKRCTIGDFLAEFAKWRRIIIWGETVIKGLLMFSMNESGGKNITLGWKVNLNAKFPFIFWNKIGINLQIKRHFACMSKNEPNLPLLMSNGTCTFRLLCPAFGLFLLRPFPSSKTWIHGMFQGFCKLSMNQERGRTWEHHPKPSPCRFLSQILAWVNTCPWHKCPLFPPTWRPHSVSWEGAAAATARLRGRWVSNKLFQPPALGRTQTAEEVSRSDVLSN